MELSDVGKQSAGASHRIVSSLSARRASPAPGNIPRIIYQTFKTAQVTPSMFAAVNSWIERNPDYGYEFFDDERMADYVASFPCSGFSFDHAGLLRAMRRIRPGAGKADLFRYLVIYERGGVYMDIDTFCITPLQRFVEPADDLVSGLGQRGDFHQWGLIYCPRHPFLKRTIENAVANILNKSFAPGYRNSLEGIAGPPCLDLSIKQVLKQPLNSRFMPGIYDISIDDETYRIKILPKDFFGGHVGFKYDRYMDDLQKLGVTYWQNDALFND